MSSGGLFCGTISATAAECEEIERRAGGRKNLIRMVANPALTGFHRAENPLAAKPRAASISTSTAKVLLPKDEIRRRLTGEFATEVSDASGMLLLDVAKRNWSKSLLSKLELDLDLACNVLRIGTSHRQPDEGGGGKSWGFRPIASSSAAPAIVRPARSATALSAAACCRLRSAPPASCLFTATTVQVDPAGPAAHVLPRRPRQVALDGRHAFRRRQPAMVTQSVV